MQGSFRYQEHFRVALGINIIVHAIRAVRLGHDDIHKLSGLFRGPHDEAALQRNIGNDFVGAFRRSRGPQLVKLEILRGSIF